MYTVKRAIIMAAGKGKRMRELTDSTPKPLLKVNGISMIETAIHGVLENGINEIIIVVGYLKECFLEIAEKYPQVRLIENPYYFNTNNISSIYVVRDYLDNAMIIEGDQFFRSPEPLYNTFEHSEYNVFWSSEPTNEWVAEADSTGKIIRCHEQGSDKGWLVYGVSRWTPQDAKLLKKWLEYEFDNNNRNIYWDNIPVFLHSNDFDIYIRETDPKHRIELDSVEELAAIDPTYKKFL